MEVDDPEPSSGATGKHRGDRNGAGCGEDEVEAPREEVEERGVVDALHDRSEDDERGCGDDERGERDVGRHEVRLIGARSIRVMPPLENVTTWVCKVALRVRWPPKVTSVMTVTPVQKTSV